MHPRPPFRPPYRPPHRPIYRPWHRPGWNIFIGSGSFYFGYGWNDWYRPSWYYPSTTVIYNEVQPEPTVINNYHVEQPLVLKNYNFYEGIKYNLLSSHPELKLDVYAPIARTIGGSPCVLLIPDGEWDGNYEKDLSSAAEYLVSKGYLCVSVSYRKYPNSKIKDSVEDVMRALYWVKNNAVKYGGDPKRIGVVGVGGGGYLAEMLAVKSTQSRSGDVNPVLGSVSAVVAIGSPSDVYNYGVLVGSERVERDLGSDSSQKGVFEGGVADFSPISQVGSYTPPILLIHADNDYVVPCELSERMKLESDARSAKVEFKTIDSDEHRIWMSPADSYNISTPIWDEVSLFLANKMKVQ